MNEKMKDTYQQMFEEHCEGAEPDYLEWFVEEFTPKGVNWADEEEAKRAIARLVKEIDECFANREEVLRDCEITPDMLP